MNKLPRFGAVVAAVRTAMVPPRFFLDHLTGENVTLNGSPVITGDLLVPATPTISFNGNPSYGGTLQGTGNASPTNYSIMGNGTFSLRHGIVRTNPISLTPVAPPPQPTGTRDVTLTHAATGDFVLNGGKSVDGEVLVPSGTDPDGQALTYTVLSQPAARHKVKAPLFRRRAG